MKTLKAGGDFIYTIVNSINDLPNDSQMLANDYVVDYEHPSWGPTKVVGHPVIYIETPENPKGPAPEFGEHTRNRFSSKPWACGKMSRS
jgi:crotonobetainyl-CoA:carnitine CoA-transferase CaiB-like acyl-CoA transferase